MRSYLLLLLVVVLALLSTCQANEQKTKHVSSRISELRAAIDKSKQEQHAHMNTEAKTATETHTQTETHMDQQADAKADAEADTEVDADAESETEAEHEADEKWNYGFSRDGASRFGRDAGDSMSRFGRDAGDRMSRFGRSARDGMSRFGSDMYGRGRGYYSRFSSWFNPWSKRQYQNAQSYGKQAQQFGSQQLNDAQQFGRDTGRSVSNWYQRFLQNQRQQQYKQRFGNWYSSMRKRFFK